MIDEFAYPPRVQEALDFVKRESADDERKEREAERARRQAACLHDNIITISAATFEDPIQAFTRCLNCGANQPPNAV